MAAIHPPDVASLIKLVNSNLLRVKQLATVLGTYGLSKTGVKAEQQKRLTGLIQDSVRQNNVAVFYQILNDVYSATNHEIPRHAVMSSAGTLQQTQSSYDRYSTVLPAPVSTGSARQGWTIDSIRSSPRPSTMDNRPSFKESPFYEMRCQVGSLALCRPATSYRGQGQIKIRLASNSELQQVLLDSKLRVYVMCANDSGADLDITFPYQSQLRVNNQEVKANLRGLKKKPGSTRPVDITDLLKLRPPTYDNSIDLIYENTDRTYTFGVYICRINPIDELIEIISSKSRITKETVIKERIRDLGGAGDGDDDGSDIEATSERLTLKCPLSCSRLSVPCRGILCAHQQCFDALSYLLLQQQGPTWSCPICNRHTPYGQLAVDEYMQDILSTTHPDTEYVFIEPNGNWEEPNVKDPVPKAEPTENSFAHDLDSYDLSEYASTPPPALTLPPSDFVDLIATGGGGGAEGGAGTKRKVVIDLTLSDDEEDDRPAKRPALALPELPTPVPQPLLNYSTLAQATHSQPNAPVSSVSRWLESCADTMPFGVPHEE